MRWITAPVHAKFLRKINRFRGETLIGRKKVFVYIPNSSRLEELLVKNREVILERVEKPARMTPYDLKAVRVKTYWVSIDSRVPNQILKWALRNKLLPYLREYSVEKPEYSLNESRIDFLLRRVTGEYMLIETKSCTLVREGVALFPDAPTERGIKHLKELMKFRAQGHRAMVFWVIQREDAKELRPYKEVDPIFTQTLLLAKRKGVELRAIKLKVTPTSLEILKEIPVNLNHE